MNFKLYFEAKVPSYHVEVIEGPLYPGNESMQKISYRVKINGKEALVGPFESESINGPEDLGWEYSKGFYTPDSHEEMKGANKAAFKAIKAYELSKELSPQTIDTFNDIIDEL